MKHIYFKDDSIVIEEERKKIFSSKTVLKEKEILVDEIYTFSREEFEGVLNSVAVFYKNGEEVITTGECVDLENLYKFIVKKREEGKSIKIIKYDIGTGKQIEI